jgi:magnesium transporter
LLNFLFKIMEGNMRHCGLSSIAKDVARPIRTTLKKRETIEEAIASLQNIGHREKITYFYVLDEESHLVGIVPTRKLLLSPKTSKIEEVMETKVVHLCEEDNLQKAFEIFQHHNLLALPVVGKGGHFLGVIDVESCLQESFDIDKASHRDDIFQLMGLTLEENSSIWRKYLLRMPWILCNILGGLLCAFISAHYEAVFSQTLVLVVFIPLVLSLSEAVSMQLMAQSLYLVRKNQKKDASIFLRPLKELKLIFIMAATTGLFVGIASLFWKGVTMASFIITLGIVLSISLTALLGAFLPLVLYQMRLDPKIASGPIVLMISDVLTMVIYLSLAVGFLL